MQREALDAFLKELGNPLGKKQSEQIDLLFARISELEKAATEAYQRQIATFAMPVVNPQCVTEVKSYPADPALVKQFNAASKEWNESRQF